MRNVSQERLETAIGEIRSQFDEVRLSESRTQTWLYSALGGAYGLKHVIETDSTVRAKFDELVQQKGIKSGHNTALALLKLTFCPNLSPVGSPERKNQLNKASRYAKLLNSASAAGISVANFVEYARRAGVQKTALQASALMLEGVA